MVVAPEALVEAILKASDLGYYISLSLVGVRSLLVDRRRLW